MSYQKSSPTKFASWFNSRNEALLFITISAIGFICSTLSFSLLNGYEYNFGKNLIGLFIPPVLTIAYLLLIEYKYPTSRFFFIKTCILYFFQIIPFIPLFSQLFRPNFGDDFARYYVYATYMIEHHTLYGADDLAWPGMGKTYLTQPGYRYFIALELILFRGLYRFVQFINIGIYIIAVFCFQKTIKQVIVNNKLRLLILILILLFTPYAIKNVLMGLAEWLTAVLLMLACYIYVDRKNTFLTVLILSLVPFLRQNILIAVICLTLWIVLHSRHKIKLSILFFISLCLPLYHNLYYAGEWRFLVHFFPTPLINKTYSTGFDFHVLIYNLSRLFGFEIKGGTVSFSFIAFLFMPYAVVLYFIFLQTINAIKWKFVFCTVTLSAILPGLYLGKDYYPRFEYMSVVLVLVYYCFLLVHLSPGKKRNTKAYLLANSK